MPADPNTRDVRLRRSSRGTRVTAITVQVVFLLAMLGGQLQPMPDLPQVDRDLGPLAWVGMAALALAAVRSLFVGVYLSNEHIRVKSWFRTYTIPLDAGTRCRAVHYESWYVTRGSAYRSVQMLFLSWEADGGRRSRSFPATAVRRSRAIGQADVVNAYITAATSGMLPGVRDYARGAIWRSITADSRERLVLRDAQPARHRRSRVLG
ncbi:hypothetical protein ASF88_05320 [Leifsonia sp. Leaf336]|uniref:hypothetical protein n=1 Tax=Leifsonia sp. Leaf336 TaxID=1736341 RepID=UPI0006F90004|nr:hypothetical protein [Leifsonia sp. Leaf336]KQR54226.1 hypothetical protein ASF88_05320 [Leifsonia sp. Leaf336]